MLVADLTVTLFIALLLGSIFVLVFGWGTSDRAEAWPALLFFVVIVWMATWALGTWMTPYGPVLWGAPVLMFLALGILFALVLAAAVPARTRRRYRAGPPPDEADVSAALGFGLFFWILLLALFVALVVGYAT